MSIYRIKPVTTDEHYPGPGFVIVDGKGERIDWPKLDTLEEAEKDVREFYQMERELGEDEVSERFGLATMLGWRLR